MLLRPSSATSVSIAAQTENDTSADAHQKDPKRTTDCKEKLQATTTPRQNKSNSAGLRLYTVQGPNSSTDRKRYKRTRKTQKGPPTARKSCKPPQLQGKARATRKSNTNDHSRLCKHYQCNSITVLQRNTSNPQLAPEREGPVLAIQPHPGERSTLWL